MSASWSRRGSSPRRRSGACGPASSAWADWRKKRHGSRGTASSGTHVSTSWTRLLRNSSGRKRSMDARSESQPTPMKNRTTVERKSERELVVTRTINGPARLVFEAWTKPELFKRWWVPKSTGLSLLSCEMDIRVGGKYRLVFRHDAFPEPMAFFGKYLEVTPHSRLVWTNEEGGEDGAVTTVTFEERGAESLVVIHDLYPSKEALDGAIASGSTGGFSEQFEQLDELLVTLDASVGLSLIHISEPT